MSPETLPFAYGMNEFTTMPWTFEEDVENYAALGVEAFELCEVKLDENRMEEQLALVGEAGLTITSVQPAVRAIFPSSMMPEPEDRSERMDRLRRTIERIAPYAPGAVFVTNTGPAPQGNMAAAVEEVVSAHRELSRAADEQGVRIALEPLSPTAINMETAIWTYGQALEIVQQVDRENVGICLDTWNLWQDPDLVAGVRSSPDRIFVLQVSDWRTPRSGADRRSVGTGEIPTGRLLHATYDAGYRGPCVVEIFSDGVPDSLYDGDLRELVQTNRAALEEAWTDPQRDPTSRGRKDRSPGRRDDAKKNRAGAAGERVRDLERPADPAWGSAKRGG